MSINEKLAFRRICPDKGYDGLETRNKEGKFKTRKELDSEWSKGKKEKIGV